MKGRKKGVTNAEVTARRAAEARAELAKRIARWEALAMLDWMLGFEKRAMALLQTFSPDPEAAAERIRSRVEAAWGPPAGPTEMAALERSRGFSIDVQETLLQIAADLDRMKATSPAAYKALAACLR